jgi:isoquinoline 1-oxidoreductase beta subunit
MAGTQFQTDEYAVVAAILGLSPDRVVLYTQFAGDGFGRRAAPRSDCVGDAAQVMKA